MTGTPKGFSYRQDGDEVVVSHHGRAVTTLRRAAAARFLADVEKADVEGTDPQQLMARVTGQYRHGNERTAKQHPRNRGR